jgi:hypothetical protein
VTPPVIVANQSALAVFSLRMESDAGSVLPATLAAASRSCCCAFASAGVSSSVSLRMMSMALSSITTLGRRRRQAFLMTLIGMLFDERHVSVSVPRLQPVHFVFRVVEGEFRGRIAAVIDDLERQVFRVLVELARGV